VIQANRRFESGESGPRKVVGPVLAPAPAPKPERSRRRLPRWLAGVGLGVVVVLTLLGMAAEYVMRNAEPILRRRVIASLEERFRSPVELDELHISMAQGVQVSGSGLRVMSIVGADIDRGEPMLTVKSFAFRTRVRQLMEPKMRLDVVQVDGIRLNIPPKEERGALFPKRPLVPGKVKTSIVIDKLICSDTVLTIETSKPGKLPLVFEISDVTLHDVGRGTPMPFEASLVNPKPIGDIRSTGHFGPWHADEPRDTPVDGEYSFTNADLYPIKGIGGTLSSTGNYHGTLGEIGVVGTTDTPNFSLDVSEHPVHLKTEFDATVDGTTGDTRLNSVRATLLHTVLNVTGMVIQAGGRNAKVPAASGNPVAVPGHIIDISVASDKARVEDLLRLAAKTSPPLMQGALTLRAHLNIPPGKVSVSKKMRVQGKFSIRGATFSNTSWQETVNKLSMRASGHPRQANEVDATLVTSEMEGDFMLANAIVDVPNLDYKMPGAEVNLAGKYGLADNTFDFGGMVRTEATASEMLTGWKSLLAMPFDSLLKKNGAGLQVPVKISGTKAAPKFGLDMGKLRGQIFGHHKGDDQPVSQQEKPDVPATHPR
jgi:hypothetical protein